jgi:thiol-disulfide isomerase/thioredoxin
VSAKKQPNKQGKGYATPKRNTSQQKVAPARSADKWSWYLLYAGVGAVVILVGFLIFNVVTNSASGDSATDDWDLPSLFDGDQRITLDDLEGKPTVVNFFASWCAECERELPEFSSAAGTYGEEVDFVFVQSQETSVGAGRSMARDHDLEQFLVARDVGAGNDELSRGLGATGMPLTAFYDASGNLIDVQRGALVNGQLVQRLQQLGLVSS